MSIKRDINKAFYKLKNILCAPKYKKFKNEYYDKNYKNSNRLILFFVPEGSYRVSGGILSICSIYRIVKNLKSIHNCDVIASYLPTKKDYDYTYRTFDNEIVIYNFEEIIKKFKNLEYLQIHLPEVMIANFKNKESKYNSFYKYISTIKNVELNILNQNDLFMPEVEYIDFIKSKFTTTTITVAHKKYASKEKRDQYNLPLHLLSPWLNPVPYKYRKFEEKENLIIYSPDDIQWIPNECELTKNEIINHLKDKLPHYTFLEIKNMKYDVYKENASKAKFAITFGEGLDGYFTETIFSGGISFAVYNQIFFSEEFKDLKTLYNSFDDLKNKIVNDIIALDSSNSYNQYHLEEAKIVNNLYSLNNLENDLIEFYTKKYDFA